MDDFGPLFQGHIIIQMTSPVKPLGQMWSYFIFSLRG